jgi:hypothetical protein
MPNRSSRAPIAVRRATLRLPDGRRIAVRFAIRALVRRRGEGDHLCRFTITGIGQDPECSVLGCDAVQAIELAIRYAGLTIERWVPAGAVWEDAPENMGLPRREAAAGSDPWRAPAKGGRGRSRDVPGSANEQRARPREALPHKRGRE